VFCHLCSRLNIVVVQGTKKIKMANCQAVDQVYKCCKVGVIRAGAAGLATAKELIREGHKVTVFEQAM